MRFAIIVLAACASQAKPAPPPPPSQCPAVADHVIGLMTASKHAAAEDVDPFRRVIIKRCTEDAWSADAQKCILGMHSLKEAESCNDLLTQDQRDKLQSDGMAVSHHGDDKHETEDSAAPKLPAPTRGPRKAGDPCEGGQ
jgi:hypothetical protein